MHCIIACLLAAVVPRMGHGTHNTNQTDGSFVDQVLTASNFQEEGKRPRHCCRKQMVDSSKSSYRQKCIISSKVKDCQSTTSKFHIASFDHHHSSYITLAHASSLAICNPSSSITKPKEAGARRSPNPITTRHVAHGGILDDGTPAGEDRHESGGHLRLAAQGVGQHRPHPCW